MSPETSPPPAGDADHRQRDTVSLLERNKMVLTPKPIWAQLIARRLTNPFWFFYRAFSLQP